MKTICISNIKGGTGASTLSILLANELSKSNTVLLLDCDPQESCFRQRDRDKKMFQNERIPYDVKKVEINEVAIFISMEKDNYDYIIIDLLSGYNIDRQLGNRLMSHVSYFILPIKFNLFRNTIEGQVDDLIDFVKRTKSIRTLAVPFLNPFNKAVKEDFNSHSIEITNATFEKDEDLGSKVNTILYSPKSKTSVDLLNEIIERISTN